MGQHNNYYAKVYILLFHSQEPSPPLTKMFEFIFFKYKCHI